jgi:two-component system sensor histidine kinase AlgZ
MSARAETRNDTPAQARGKSAVSSAPASETALLVVPDFCNLGVVLRVLLAVNAGGFLVAVGAANSWNDTFARFLGIAALLEPGALATLALLCALRNRLADETPAGRAWSAAAVCALSVMMVEILITFVAPSLRLAAGWFGLLAPAACAAGVAAAAMHYFEVRARAFSPAIASARLQALQSRIRPHFLFNSLNAAISLVRSDPAHAELMLEDLSDIFRMLMGDSRTLVTLGEEVGLAKQYLAIEKVRLGDRLQVDWETHRMPESHQVPPLLLQPLLENAVHHGIEPNITPGRIQVRITGVARELIIVVENTYEPSTVVPGNGLALKNIRERLALLYDLEARVTSGGDGSMYRVAITLPLHDVPLREGAFAQPSTPAVHPAD